VSARAVGKLAAPVARLFRRDASALPLGVLRIGFALVSLLEVARLYAFRDFHFDPVPGLVPAPWYVEPALLLWMAALAALLAGWRTRLAAAVNYAMAVAFLGVWAMRSGSDWHIDSGFLTGSLLMLVSPVGASLSVDRLVERARAAAARARSRATRRAHSAGSRRRRSRTCATRSPTTSAPRAASSSP